MQNRAVLDLANPSSLKEFLTKHGLWASKGLGQHFLISSKVVNAIVESLSDCAGILEIGPGPGVLTSPLSERAEKMIAIELDTRMIAALHDSSPRAEVLQADALATNLDDLLEGLPHSRGVVSNLPYYITGPLLTKIAESRGHFDVAVLMMQKEVADRVVAKPKTSARGSLSVYLQLQFDIEQLVAAPAGAFLPPPKVDSAVLRFLPVSTTYPEELFKLIRLGFQQPRKTLINNLVSGYAIDRVKAQSVVMEAGFKETSRPQELTNEEWIKLYESVRARLKAEDTRESQ